MFSLSKGEPPTPPTTTTSPPTAEIGATPCELPQFQKTEGPLRTRSAPMALSSTSADQHQTEIGVPIRDIPPIRTQSAPRETDSGFEASPSGLNDPGSFFGDDNDVGFDDVFLDNEMSGLMLEREDDDDLSPDCDEISSCSCSRAESSLTVRTAVMTDPNTCDSDSSSRSSSPPQSPPPPSLPIPASSSHFHNNRLPCPRCSGDESLEDETSSVRNIVSRSFPGSFPASLLRWWTQSSTSSPRVTTPTDHSNRSDDRRRTRNRRRQIDSEASSSSSCDENSTDEVFHTSCEDSCVEDLGTMTEAEELRVTSPEQLPDLVPLSSDSSSRRVRSQSVSIPLDQESIREIGISLRRLSNEFENRFAERNSQPRRASLTSFLNWRS